MQDKSFSKMTWILNALDWRQNYSVSSLTFGSLLQERMDIPESGVPIWIAHVEVYKRVSSSIINLLEQNDRQTTGISFFIKEHEKHRGITYV